MESPTKASTVNGTLQKTAKHQDMRLETGVEGNGYDRAETIEDIISELNATAKKDAPLSEAPVDVMLHGDGQQSIDSEDRCDPTTDSKASSSGNVDGGKRDSTPASTREEAKSAAVSTDVSVSAEGENIVASHASEIDSEDARKVENASNGDSDQPLEGEKASECLNTLETDAEEQSVNECNDKETTKAVPDLTEADDGSNEVITSDIKVPDEAVMSPRRTARQRTVSLKLAESATSSPSRKRRHGSEGSDASSIDTPPSKQESKQGCITSDSEVDVPLAKRRCRKLSAEGGVTKATVKTNRLTSDSEGDSPLKKLKRSPKLANRLASSNGDSPLAKRMRNPKLASKVTSESESDSPLIRRKGSAKLAKKIPEHSQTRKGDVQSVEPPSRKKSKKNLLQEFPEDKGAVKSDNDRPDLQSSEQNSTKRGKPTDTKRAQNLANKAKRKAVCEEHPLSSTLVNHSTHEDREESCGVSKPKKAKDEAGSSTEGILDSSGAASAMVGKKKRLVKSKELKNDSSIGLNVGDIGGSGDTRADEKGSSFPEQNSFAQSAGAVSSWSSSHFKASDHHLQKSIQLSLKDWAPSARPSYLTIEVPSVNARRMWGPGFSRQRPTVVFGGCDPLNTYVNVDGVRVLLLQWQKVSNIIPTIRLTDIFQCFKNVY